jgi:hypothetical protein
VGSPFSFEVRYLMALSVPRLLLYKIKQIQVTEEEDHIFVTGFCGQYLTALFAQGKVKFPLFLTN